jgi:secreted PhoX family phosphatase
MLMARNAVSGSEFTGVVFAPDGQTLFANIQDEGYTFAITGPFETLRKL